MLDALPNQYYTCSMNNLFISAKFLRAAYAETKSKTMVHIIFWQKGRGLPNFVVQEDYENIGENDKIRGDTKAAVF